MLSIKPPTKSKWLITPKGNTHELVRDWYLSSKYKVTLFMKSLFFQLFQKTIFMHLEYFVIHWKQEISDVIKLFSILQI